MASSALLPLNPDSPDYLTTLLAPGANDRLSIPFLLRLPLSTFIGGVAGFGLGLSHGSTEAGLRYRAENAHRFPTTQTGWYLYHKSKNYNIALGGIYEGARMARRQGVWVGVFVGMEECIDRGRAGVMRHWRGLTGLGAEQRTIAGSRDCFSSVLAGVGTAGAFSLWNRFPVPTAVRLAKLGGKIGLGYGLVQDVVSLLRGRRVGYVELVKKYTFGTSEGHVGADGMAATTG